MLSEWVGGYSGIRAFRSLANPDLHRRPCPRRPDPPVGSGRRDEPRRSYVERQFAPALKPGQIVVADNLSSYKSSPALAFLRAQRNELIFLPPYSPDLDPIEMAFSKLKTIRRENDYPDVF